MTLCIAYTTARKNPCFEWFRDSLCNQRGGWVPEIIVVDLFKKQHHRTYCAESPLSVLSAEVKPDVWQGKHRLTKQDWWAVATARNTALCLCRSDYIVWLDDRCVLNPTWFEAVQDAIRGQYAVCGNYEKRHDMIVENGVITNDGTLSGKDARDDGRPLRGAPNQFWGGTLGCPTEWALEVNGFEELTNGLGSEDYLFGMMLQNNGHIPIYDPRLKVIQDRTPSESGPDMKRTSKERFPNDTQDKAHVALRRFGGAKRSQHQWNLREIRERVLRGEPFPIPTEPKTDWYDGQLLSEM